MADAGDILGYGLAPFTAGASLGLTQPGRKAIGDVFSSAKDHMPGRDTTRPPNFAESGLYNPNAFQYGGQPGGADAAAGRYGGLMDQANGRAAFASGRANDWDQAAGHAGELGLYARGGQQDAAEMMRRRAMGLVPSISGMQAQQDMQRAQAAQGSLAASARGPAALALAQQQAANNTANAFGSISGQAQINGANERLQAEQGMGNAYGMIRQGDTLAQNAAGQMYGQANTAGYQAGQTGIGYGNLESGVNKAQLEAQGHGQTVLANSVDAQNTGLMRQGAANAANEMDYLKGFVGMARDKASTPSSGGGGGGGGGGNDPGYATGGLVQAGRPIRVGEKGPEFFSTSDGGAMVGLSGPEHIVPHRDGYIIPNHMIRGLY